MKQIALLFTVTILFFSQQSCGNRQQTSTQSADSTELSSDPTTSEPAAEVSIRGHLADLGLTIDSDWRGINLGDEFTKIKSIEKEQPFESDAQHAGYTVELKNLETADILYHQTNKKVSAIEVDLFLNSRQSVTDYQKELEPYFTGRYGAPKPGAGLVWTGKKGEIATVKDVSKGKDFGLKIRIAPAQGSTMASAK